MRREVIILVSVTLLIRLAMFVSFPFSTGNKDDNQAAQRFLINEVRDGDIFIGNLRYNTGYAYAIAPVFALAAPFGRFGDRIVLAVQVGLSALIPLIFFDLIQRHWSRRAALIIGLCVALDPFTLQWPHFVLPGWWVAWCCVVALWCLDRARTKGKLLWVILAGLLLGMAALGRLNFAPTVAALAFTMASWTSWPRIRRAAAIFLVGACSAGLLVAYLFLIHVPSTGVLRLSCITGVNLLPGLASKGVPMVGENGPKTREYLALEKLPPLKPVNFFASSYPLWQKASDWDELAPQKWSKGLSVILDEREQKTWQHRNESTI